MRKLPPYTHSRISQAANAVLTVVLLNVISLPCFGKVSHEFQSVHKTETERERERERENIQEKKKK